MSSASYTQPSAVQTGASDAAIPLILLRTEELPAWLAEQAPARQAWVADNGFRAKAGQSLRLPAEGDQSTAVVVGWDGEDNLATLGGLPLSLPEGIYAPAEPLSELALLGWHLGAYQFTRYKQASRAPATLQVPASTTSERAQALASAVYLTRDLINTPAGDLLPSDLAAATAAVAEEQGANFNEVVGDDLLTAGYRTIHAVGRAATDAPRLIELTWGAADAPKITLVGKGICFDSGGLDIKPSSAMRTMKKDMGGAAQALGLAQAIMALKLPVRLRLLIAAAENAISGNAFRPGDIIETYSGRTVEIDNTDAEGRLVLCDALTLACEETPALLVDFATLTGSARSAVGAEISAMFANDDSLAEALYDSGVAVDDPVWRLPLHAPYRALLKSSVADTLNSAPTPFAGAITAALYLEDFVTDVPWVHFDLMAFNTRTRPGRPEGGEAMALRAVFDLLERRYGGGS